MKKILHTRQTLSNKKIYFEITLQTQKKTCFGHKENSQREEVGDTLLVSAVSVNNKKVAFNFI